MAQDGATARRSLVHTAIGIGATTGAYGLPFGAVARAAGLDVAQACALSLLMFTGGSQFALVAVVAGGGAPLAGAASAVLLGSRNALYGATMAPRLRLAGWRKVAAAQVTIDESTALALSARDGLAGVGFWAAGLSVFVLWNLGTLVGALATGLLTDPRTLGLDAAAPAAFAALVAPRLDARDTRAIAVVAAAAAVASVPLVPAGVPVLVAAAVAVAIGLRARRTA